jgi:hypothetical protein
VAEQTTKEIDSWSVSKAKAMAHGIKERHGATPYGFQFTTRERGDKDFDSKEVKRSGMYYLGGKVLTVAELKARNDPKDRTLILNMENNNWPRIVENTNSWKWTQPLKNGDKIISFKPRRT